ncbi:unnamed protein product [Rotaria sp. Silwood1]|nr:unnamed protein product [Rotaria sp. Silwood1]
MGRKVVDIATKKSIILLRDSGMSQHEICRRLNTSRNCIRQTIRKFNELHTVATKPGAGRHSKLTDRQKRAIKLQKVRDDILSVTDLVRQRCARLDWCYQHLTWTEKDWSNVIFTDENFKYFEDKTDEVRDPMGTLFPLWKFPPSFSNRSVTALTWNPAYSDMLIIGYGLYDQAERIQGTIAVFTLNNNHPDTLIHTESTVLSIDCLPSKPYLICVGLMDGDVIVYDISTPSGKAVFTNTSYMCKHYGCVWQVRWCNLSTNHQPRFFSIGADGKVMRWTCIKGELRQILLLDLPSATKATRLDDGTLLSLPGPAIAFDFHRNRKDIFLVGTEDGKIYKASTNDPGIIDMIFDAHDFAIYCIQWSPFHPNIFASCSADGTTTYWYYFSECLMRFDLCTSLQDMSWSPYTSTMFTIAGADGKVYIFDIHSNKLEPICEQLLANESGKACTKIAFNPIHPILLVGDQTGWTICLKLSPNLRKKAKIRKGAEFAHNHEREYDKLAQELSRTVAGDSMNDILIDPTNDIED